MNKKGLRDFLFSSLAAAYAPAEIARSTSYPCPSRSIFMRYGIIEYYFLCKITVVLYFRITEYDEIYR